MYLLTEIEDRRRFPTILDNICHLHGNEPEHKVKEAGNKQAVNCRIRHVVPQGQLVALVFEFTLKVFEAVNRSVVSFSAMLF